MDKRQTIFLEFGHRSLWIVDERVGSMIRWSLRRAGFWTRVFWGVLANNIGRECEGPCRMHEFEVHSDREQKPFSMILTVLLDALA